MSHRRLHTLLTPLALLVALSAASPGPGPADAPDITVQRPESPTLLGDWFDLTVTGPGLQNLRIDVMDHLGDVLLTPPRQRDLDGVVTIQQRMCIAREGDYSLPLAVVDEAGDVHQLEPLVLRVQLDVPDGHRNQVADLLGPLAVPMPAADIRPFLAVVILVLAILGRMIVADGRARPIYHYEPPADLVAIRQLADLRLHLPRTSEEVRPFVIRVSDVLRVYMERVFEIHAPSQTTEEFLAEAALRHDALGDRRETLAGFLTGCDLVKYAGERPAPSTAEPLIATVESFVEETRAGVATPAPEVVGMAVGGGMANGASREATGDRTGERRPT